jgi:N-acetylglucosaminyldiphosphoundecaprenol N-acetyl-beta-D-mannosaminyltransferase
MKVFDEVVLLGTRFHKLKVDELISYTVKAAKLRKKTIISHVNVRAMNFAYELPWYKDFLNKSDLVFCDGLGVILGAKACGCCMDSSHRMTCPDYIENLALACEREGLSLFLLAGKVGIVDKAIGKLSAIAPNLKVTGHHGYFDKSGKENQLAIEQINEFKPDILYVGFGMPLQEQWIQENIDHINAKVFLPLGACLDFYTAAVSRGPRWMTDNGMEWLARLFTEPQRLWERYLIGNPLFFMRLFKGWLKNSFDNSDKNIKNISSIEKQS